MFSSKTGDTDERTLCPISHAVNFVLVNGKQQGGEGAPLFLTKRWLNSRLCIPIQQSHLHLQKVLPVEAEDRGTRQMVATIMKRIFRQVA
jgi:hypothetical protein